MSSTQAPSTETSQTNRSPERQPQPQASAGSSPAGKASAGPNCAGSSGAGAKQSGSASGLPNGSQPGGQLCSSSVFQQVKQTQASLARLSRVHQQLNSQTNPSSHQRELKQTSVQPSVSACSPKHTTFVDCLIRRFKDCFSEDFCTVPMFVVGNLSPGSDGTHLILPPCVSLGGQSISRFASPKNLRLLSSIRESCRTIEELDLGSNKLNDLIEVYKILQCTPNLRFLNLSENDLSRSSPVAMASTPSSSAQPSLAAACHAGPSLPCPSQASHQSVPPNSGATPLGATPGWPTGSSLGQRSFLAPIHQNQQAQHQPMGSRRHSSLGQSAPDSPQLNQLRLNQRPNRVAEARQLAATAAVAQSKKTSSSLASKLASSAAVSSASARQSGRQASRLDGLGSQVSDHDQSHKDRLMGGTHCRKAAPSSTMHLARSLSSLSAKDLRAGASTGSAISRLNAHRAGPQHSRAGTRVLISSSGHPGDQEQPHSMRQAAMANQKAVGAGGRLATSASSELLATNVRRQIIPSSSSSSSLSLSSMSASSTNKLNHQLAATKLSARSGQAKLFAEPIDESNDDVDMSEQQVTTDTISVSVGGQQANPLTAQAKALAIQPANATPTRSSLFGPAGPTIAGGQSSVNYRRTFESIRALALNNTGCQWRVVCSILRRMPNLEELHLSLNNYERIDLDPNEFRHVSLKRLYLCNNPKLTNWEELDKLLLAFPSLEALSIADCNISQIPDNLDRAREWRKLCGLNINGWPIKEWPVVERLNQLPSLIDLKCRNLELLSNIEEPRHHLIARLPKLQRLNGSEIEEREHAEKAFLRFFLANSQLERPNRYYELVKIHGEFIGPVDVVNVDLSPPSQANVKVVFLNKNYLRKENHEDIFMSEDFLSKLMDNFEPSTNSVVQQQQQNDNTTGNSENMDAEAELEAKENKQPVRLFKDDSQEVVAIDVDLRQSVRKFKSVLATLFGLSSRNVILYYIDHEMVGLMGPELIKHNQKKLWNYNVQDGDQFIVEER